MTPTLPPSPAETSGRPRFPRWTRVEQDLWIDMLDGYSNTLLQGSADEELTEESGAALVRLAAVLADVAVQETGYRFWVQQQRKREPKARRARAKR